jgi:arsenate reductase
VKRVLFLCTGNSARSILAEAIVNELSDGGWIAHSAGSNPVGQVNPGALRKLSREGLDVRGLASKSWDLFAGCSDALDFDIVITVCDNAAGESCPVWNGSPVTVHWGIPDPAPYADEEERDAAFDRAYESLRCRIEGMIALPDDMPANELRHALQQLHEAGTPHV